MTAPLRYSEPGVSVSLWCVNCAPKPMPTSPAGRWNRFGVDSVASIVSSFEMPRLFASWNSPLNAFGVAAGFAKFSVPFW